VTEPCLTPPVVMRRYTTCMEGSTDSLDADAVVNNSIDGDKPDRENLCRLR
jgi:hypothetical protein